MHTISSNGFSVDQQASDALDYLRGSHVDAYCQVRTTMPEALIFDGGWLDTDAMGVDQEWGSWLADAIEATGLVQWIQGEPYAGPFDELNENEEPEGDACGFCGNELNENEEPEGDACGFCGMVRVSPPHTACSRCA